MASVQFALSLLVAMLVTRGMRGRRVAWPVVPLSALVPAVILGLVVTGLEGGVPQVGLSTASALAAFGLLGCASGVALGLRGQPRWNLRRSWGVPVAVLLVATELALMAAWWGGRIAPHELGTSAVLLLSGLAVALASSRRGATPAAAEWTRRLRYATSFTVAMALGAWWLRAEALSWAPGTHALTSDYIANGSTLAAWVLPAGLAMAVVPSLVSMRLGWIRRVGPVVLAASMLMAPMVLGGLVMVDNATCAQHFPVPDSFAERLALQRAEKDAPWCRATPEYYPICDDEISRWTLERDGWEVEGARFRGDAVKQPLGDTVISRDRAPLTPGLAYTVAGVWTAPQIETALEPHLEDVRDCLGSSVRSFGLHVVASREQIVVNARNVDDSDVEACIEDALAALDLPDAGCTGTASFSTTLNTGVELTSLDR